jgi:hypothetical protein
MESKGSVTQVGVVLECAVGMAGMTSPTAVTEPKAFQAGAMCAPFQLFILVTKTVMVRTWRVPSLAMPILLRAWTAPEEAPWSTMAPHHMLNSLLKARLKSWIKVWIL